MNDKSFDACQINKYINEEESDIHSNVNDSIVNAETNSCQLLITVIIVPLDLDQR